MRSVRTTISVPVLLLLLFAVNTARGQNVASSFLFTENIGQWPAQTVFGGGAGSMLVGFERGGVSFRYAVTERGERGIARSRNHTIRAEFVGGARDAEIVGNDPTGGVRNYYLGAKKEHLGARDFRTIVYRDIYKGIDARWKEQRGRMKYEFVIAPGASVDEIAIRYEGISAIAVGAGGELAVETPFGTVREDKPYCFQMIDGEEIEVEGAYRLIDDRTYGFALGACDPRHPVVIDPCLSIEYLTYLGGGGFDEVTSMAVDSSGNAFAVGFTRATTFPTVPDSGELPALNHAFISKISPDGSTLLYSTILGEEYRGIYARDSATITTYEPIGEDVEVGSDGRAVVAITTNVQGLRTTTGVYAPRRSSNTFSSNCGPPFADNLDAYIVRMNDDGSIDWATYLGAGFDDYVVDIALDANDNVAITGTTHTPRCGNGGDRPNFPSTNPPDAFNYPDSISGFEAFITLLAADGTRLIFSTPYGGRGEEFAGGIAVGNDGTLYTMGSTSSRNLILTPNPFRSEPPNGGIYDLYIARIDPVAGRLLYSSYVGDEGGGRRGLGFGGYESRRNLGVPILGMTAEDRFQGILVESDGVVLLGGTTKSNSLPTTGGAFRGSAPGPEGTENAFVIRLDLNANRIVNATYVGGSGFDAFGGMAYDMEGNVVLGIATASSDYPITPINIQQNLIGKVDGAITVLRRDLGGIDYSSYIGGGAPSGALLWEQSVTGVVVDRDGAAYLCGGTVSFDLPVTPNALARQNDYHGGWIVKFVSPTVARIGTGLELDIPPEACEQFRIAPQLLFNSGQTPLVIDTIFIERGSPFTLVSPTSFPFTLGPCDTLSLLIGFDPNAPQVRCDRPARDTIAIISSNAVERLVRVPVSGSRSCLSFRFDTTEVNGRIRFGSTQAVGFLAFVSGDGVTQRVTMTPAPTNSGNLVPTTEWNDTPVTIGTKFFAFKSVAPDTGFYCETFYVTVEPCTRRDTLRVCATVSAGFFNIDPESIDLGLIGCVETIIPVKIWNTGNDSLSFKPLFVEGTASPDISYDVPWDTLRTIPRGDTFRFNVIHRPKGVGRRDGRIVYETTDPREVNPSQIVTAELDSVAFRLELNNLVGSFGDVLTLPLDYQPILDGRVPTADLTVLLRYNPNALELADIERTGTLTAGWEVAENRLTEQGRIIRLVLRQGGSGSPLTGPGILANLKMKVLRGDTVGSPLGIVLEGVSKGCLFAEVDTVSTFSLSEECLAHERLIYSDNRMLKAFTPNPSGGMLRIPFRVPQSGRVALRLFDVSGSEIALLLDREMNAGNDELFVDVSALAAGRYFVRMTVGDVLTDVREVIVR